MRPLGRPVTTLEHAPVGSFSLRAAKDSLDNRLYWQLTGTAHQPRLGWIRHPIRDSLQSAREALDGALVGARP